ncbi:RagB/SusD family nutrient uptake outer membrane protein [Aurantibacter crassamenti]|uniref:RagB/SusD family nutrient uptake outer membrane protein n=1 Tax=Aurantibacter crassamenti TaxID=1837375 RepID=UPI001939D9D4|nr:RagB/SusD family nutrient uptake outer membrane protein [Aurantibacter crassamenti]MBM1106793.1 RagB/SusD family nutrient uptake outer membrane protein [Aurantibacter crassamenti]
MKKKIIYYACLFMGVLACNDSFTELPAVGALSEEALANAEGVDLLLIGAYSTLDGESNTRTGNQFGVVGDNWWMDVIADEAHKGSTDSDQPDLFALEVFNWNTSNSFFLGKWEALFAGINRANAVISLISTIEDVDLTNQLAEARFLRGHFNFELQVSFGNVPYISEENYAATEFNQPNPGPIWEQIEADFQFAIDNLPASQADVGRPSSWAAKSYMGKTLLQQKKWDSALTILNDVILNGPYDLNAEYVDNWALAGENSIESIFAIQFTADSGQSFNGNRSGSITQPADGALGTCCGFYQPSQDMVNAFETDASGLPLLDTYSDVDIANDAGLNDEDPFTPFAGTLDPRLDYSVGRRGIEFNGFGAMPGSSWVRATFADISGPYLPKKNVYREGEDANRGTTGAWGQQSSGINYDIIRFADVLLMAAEAAAQTNDLETAVTYVDRVRLRAKNMTYIKAEDGTTDAANYLIEPYVSFADQAFAIKAVRHERRMELSMEGKRLFDLRRYGNSIEVINEYIANEARTIPNFGQKAAAAKDAFVLFPIPINAIDLSGNVLKQNTGY